MNEPLVLSDALIETMLLRRARRADPGDLAEIALEVVRRTPARSGRPWDGLVVLPRLASGSTRLLWVGIAALLSLALLGGLLEAGLWRLARHPYPIVTAAPALSFMSRAVSGDELWIGGSPLWHYVGGAWQGPISVAPLESEMVTGIALGPDGTLWVSGESTVAALRSGVWSAAWTAAAPGLRGLAVAPDGTVWVGHGHDLVALRKAGAGYSSQTVVCPHAMSRFAVTTDGTIYGGGFSYSDGYPGLAKSDGITCALVDPLGDGQAHDVADLTAGPDGSLLATIFVDTQTDRMPVWSVLLQGGRWSTVSGPTSEPGVTMRQAIAPDGHPWRIVGLPGDLQRYDHGVWQTIASSVSNIVMAPDGVLWYQTDRGIERIRTDEY